MPDNLMAPLARTPLTAGCRIVMEAVDPTTGAAVSGVTVSQVVISGVPFNAGDDDAGSTLGVLGYVGNAAA